MTSTYCKFLPVKQLSVHFSQGSGKCGKHADLPEQTSLKTEPCYQAYHGFYQERGANYYAGLCEVHLHCTIVLVIILSKGISFSRIDCII